MITTLLTTCHALIAVAMGSKISQGASFRQVCLRPLRRKRVGTIEQESRAAVAHSLNCDKAIADFANLKQRESARREKDTSHFSGAYLADRVFEKRPRSSREQSKHGTRKLQRRQLRNWLSMLSGDSLMHILEQLPDGDLKALLADCRGALR